MISITIPVVSGHHLTEVLDSIYSQKYQDFEVIVVNGSNGSTVADILNSYDVKEVKLDTSLIESRLVSAGMAAGEHVLQLDETRKLVDSTVLEMLSSKATDVVFINETEVISNFLTKAAAIDKLKSFSTLNIRSERPYVLPRYYRTSLLRNSLAGLKIKLGPVFSILTAPEDLLVYIESRPSIRSVGMIEKPAIIHYGDRTISSVVRKYYRYGTNFSLLTSTQYESVEHVSIAERLKGRLHGYDSFSELLMVLALWGIRGTSFFIGKDTHR